MPEFKNVQFKDTMIQKFKEAALIAFLCRASKQYDSYSLSSLSKSFDLEEPKLLQILSKIILKNTISASIDVKDKLLVLDKDTSEVKELQQLSLQYVEKLE